uniref:F-box domain-containing protein n=1 Tax=Oryza brachyantha TaxID=4533 RepID=J3LF04_ORYBR
MAGGAILFSDDIVANILAWLPPKQAARMRLVCKQWFAVTSEHHFMHTNYTKNRAGHSIAGFFLSNELHKKLSYSPLRDSTTHPTAPDLSFIPARGDTFDPGNIYVTSSCNGPLLCRAGRPRAALPRRRAATYVCNPATKRFVEIPTPPDGRRYYLNLAYDPSKSPVYKIVALGQAASTCTPPKHGHGARRSVTCAAAARSRGSSTPGASSGTAR